MQIEIKIDDNCTEPKVIIITDKVNDEINDILNTLSSKTPELITGFHNGLAEFYRLRTLSVFTRRAAKPLPRSTRKNIISYCS